jgi:autoinducer 2-degrading protein
MTGFVITVDFNLKPGAMAEFRRLVDRNAQESCRNEPGCSRFDVLIPVGQNDRILLYEIYSDRAAFDAHLKTPHYDLFSRESAPLVVGKHVAEFELACEGSQT